MQNRVRNSIAWLIYRHKHRLKLCIQANYAQYMYNTIMHKGEMMRSRASYSFLPLLKKKSFTWIDHYLKRLFGWQGSKQAHNTSQLF